MTKQLKHILCVDDEQDILDVAQMCLETVGEYKVSTLNSGLLAVKQAADINPDVILLDVMMPEMDGLETMRQLRKNPALGHIPIIFMTARVRATEIDEYLEMGATDVIAKPFDPMELSKQVAKIYEKFHG